MKNKIVIDTVQVALFPIDYKVKSVNALAGKLVEAGLLDNTSSATVINSFLNVDAPGEITRIKGPIPKTEEMEIDFSQAKINLFWRNKKGVDSEVKLEKLNEYLGKYIKCLGDDSGVELKFWRVGYITTVYKEGSDALTVAKSLWNHKEGDVTGINYEITYDDTEKYRDVPEWNNVNFNKNVKISYNIKKSNPKVKAVLVQYDLNTRPEPKVNWGLEETQRFVKKANELSDGSDIYKEFFG